MILEDSLSMDQMTAVLDNAPVAIYVTAVNDWKLLYANRLAKDLLLHKPDDQGITCYQAAGFDKPCPFCKAEKMNRQDLFMREFHHPVSRRIYQLSGKLIDWAGTTAHIEYILDITEKKREEEHSRALKKELQDTFRSIPCGLSVYRFDGEKITPLFHNPAFYHIMGYSQTHISSIERETSFLGVHEEDMPALQAKIQTAIKHNSCMQHTYRVWNDKKSAYCWIHLEGSVKSQPDGTKFLYGVYSDVSEQIRLEKELTAANGKMQDIINAIPGGVAIYKVTDIFETIYFSDGVPELSGYSVKEYQQFIKRDAAEMIYWEDTAMVVSKAKEVIDTHQVTKFEFRKQHRDGHIVWVSVQIKWIGEEDGCPLLHCVFHNITDLKEAQLEMEHLVNSIPGGIASYRIEGDRFVPTFYSNGVMALSDHTREEFDALVQGNALNSVYEPDRERVLAATKTAVESGNVLDVSYRMRHKDGNLIWIHLNGRRMGPLTDSTWFYAVFTGMSAEARLFQSIANEMADGIYVIDKENYDLLYANETKGLFVNNKNCLGQKCYAALHEKDSPCEFCTLKCHEPDGEEHEMCVGETNRFYTTRFRETEWNGIPAYIKYIRDVTQEVTTRREKERLEMYFHSVIDNLPGGISVIRYNQDGSMVMEFISDGYASLLHMTTEEAEKLYQQDIWAGFHPDDVDKVRETLHETIEKGENRCELVGRLKRKDGGYVWVKSVLSVLQTTDGVRRLYSVYTDITKTIEEKEQLRLQYNDLIMQHYRTPGPNALVVGHCNITQNRILEIIDYTNSNLLQTFGTVREEFFTGISGFIMDDEERQAFLHTYLNAPALAAYSRNETEKIMVCFVKLPQDSKGRYVQFQMSMVTTPDSGGVTGILTVTDITEQIINDRILHQLSISNYDFVIDMDLEKDTFTVLSSSNKANCLPKMQGIHSERTAYMLQSVIVPKDREKYRRALDPMEIRRRLEKEESYTFAFSIIDEDGEIRTKNMTVSAVDLRLGRVCFVRIDITESIREQQGLLNMIAYTFDLACFLHVGSGSMTMYTRETVLKNLSPHIIENYNLAVDDFSEHYGNENDREDVHRQFQLETMLHRLEQKPKGYDFVFPYRENTTTGDLRYKQVNVLWGDENHQTICLVRADVTDMLANERQTKKELEKALTLAEEANRAKSDFLSAMSHDIRTPMNAIMGMNALAVAHLDDPQRVADCLNKISISSRHLLSLINDILDMSKIERSKITLNHWKVSLQELMAQLSAIMGPQARAAGLQFDIQLRNIEHTCFYGDSLRINQILINLLSNAVKFTPEGGMIAFTVEEIPALKNPEWARYRFTIRDNGIGMSEEFLTHIFDPFTRNQNVAHVEGTGLGLSVTKGLINLMDGTITVESNINKGSTFRVELECEPAQAENAVHGGIADNMILNSDSLFAGRSFLIAEDNTINAEILCELLAMQGADTTLTTDGKAVVRVFRQAEPGTFDAILMDIQMPEMNGYEATRIIREMKRPDAETIPIIAMTANAFAEDVQASVDAGMTAHVSKPIDVDIMRNTLFKIFNDNKK